MCAVCTLLDSAGMCALDQIHTRCARERSAPKRRAAGAPDRVVELRDSDPEASPAITALLEDGPLADRSSAEDSRSVLRRARRERVSADDGSACRYCLAEWVQTGRSARYAFLYRV
jgi:hypothetical protein